MKNVILMLITHYLEYISLTKGGALKNVDYVYGLVVYTGKDTKIMQNIQ
jgi:hypothetical protein